MWYGTSENGNDFDRPYCMTYFLEEKTCISYRLQQLKTAMVIGYRLCVNNYHKLDIWAKKQGKGNQNEIIQKISVYCNTKNKKIKVKFYFCA